MISQGGGGLRARKGVDPGNSAPDDVVGFGEMLFRFRMALVRDLHVLAQQLAQIVHDAAQKSHVARLLGQIYSAGGQSFRNTSHFPALAQIVLDGGKIQIDEMIPRDSGRMR